MKNCSSAIQKFLHSKPGGIGSKINRTTSTRFHLLLLMIAGLLTIPSPLHVNALQPVATPAIDSFVNEPILKTIIIDNYAPYTFVNKNGQPDGFSVDLMQTVAKVMGLKLEIKVDTWDNARHALDNSQIDFLPMMAYSAERDKLYDFSPPHTIAYDAFFTRKDASPIRSVGDLPGKKIIVMESDQAHDYLNSLASTRAEQLILVASLPEALRLLASGTGDTALMPKLIGLALIRDLNLVNISPSPVVVETYNRPFSFAVRNGNQAVLERLNQGLSIVKATGQYDEIYRKWFGAMEPVGITNELFLKYLGGIVLAFLLTGAILLLWSFSLRSQVAARTRSLEMEIQERKQAEEALKENAALLHTVAANYPNSYVSIVNKDLTIDFASGQEFKKQNLDPTQFVGLTLEQVFGEHASIVRDHYHKTFDGAETQFELFINNQHQYYRTVPLMNPEGKINKILVVVENITERKQTEETLRKSEERFRSYFNLPLAGRAITSPDAGWIDVNPTLCDMLGYQKAELMQMSWTELTYPDDLPADLVQFNRVMAGEIDGYTLEKRFIHKDGHSIATNLVVHCVRRPDQSVDFFVALIQDFTARKQAEQALQESESKYRLSELELKNAQSTAHIGNWKWDVSKGEITWSDEMYRIFGIEKDSFSGRLGDVVKSVIHPDDLHLVLPSNAANLANEPIEYRIILPDSTIRHIWAKSGATITDQDGKPTFLTGIAQDITERKLAEEALRKSEENLADAQRISHIGSWQWDMLSNTVSWSKEMYQVFDIDPNTHDGKPESILKVIYPDDIELFTNSMNSNLVDGSSPALEYRIVHKDGSIHTISAIGRIEFDKAGKPIRSNGTVQDITERKLAEEALLQANERLSFAQKSSKAGVWDWNMTTGLLTWSPEFLILFGLDPDTTPTFDVWRKVIHPDDLQIAEARINDAIREHTLLENNYRIILPSGEIRWINALGNTTYDDHGVPQRMSGICIDISERKLADEALRTSEENFRNVFNTMQEGMALNEFIFDENGEIVDYRILEVNPAFERHSEAPRNWVVGKTATDAYQMSSEYINSFWKQHLNRSDEIVTELYYANTDRWKYISTSQPVNNRFVTVFTDITEKKLAEIALRESEARLKTITKHAPAIIIEVDPHGRILYISRKLPGLELSDVIGEDFCAWTPAQFHPIMRQKLEQVFLNGKPEEFETQGLGSFGENSWYLSSLAPVEVDGQIKSAILVMHDITERKQAEEQLNQQLEELRRWQNITQGRENRILQLKSEINRLLIDAGKPPRFASVNGVNLDLHGELE